MKKLIIYLAIVLVGIFVGYEIGSKSNDVTGFSAVGATTSTAKFYSAVMSLASGSATSTSILNSTGYDWGIQSSTVFCNGVGTSKTAYSGTGLANLVVLGATTSSAITNSLTSVNSNYGTNINVSTSTVISRNSTSTEGVIAGYSDVVPNGTYYTFQPNATNTGSCTVGFNVIQL